jgi:hypothetical protein
MIGNVHSCYLFAVDQRLNFDAGTTAFTVGATVTGESSEATGIVKTVTVSTGSWGENGAVGYLVLSNVSGTFENDETLTGNPAGAATANGANTDYVDAYGKKTQTVSSASTTCRFYNKKAVPGDLEYGWSGSFPAVILPAGTTLFEGQKISSTETGFSHTFEIQWPPVYYHDGVGTVHHITCGLKAVS